MKWVPSADQQADVFTKALARPLFEKFRDELMGPLSQPPLIVAMALARTYDLNPEVRREAQRAELTERLSELAETKVRLEERRAQFVADTEPQLLAEQRVLIEGSDPPRYRISGPAAVAQAELRRLLELLERNERNIAFHARALAYFDPGATSNAGEALQWARSH